ncbi:MAG: TIM barrel protein [Fusicatenibacter sp.]|nr:TIM barrel protein [Lachnospiraceae bacterium]MDY2937519.1 TIM barrel protein [Fusicatenibacter sp.]
METGIQVSSLKPLLTTAEQVKEAFQKLSGLGCSLVQLQWIDPCVPAESIAAALLESGIRSVSVQDFYETVRTNFTYYTELNAVTGGEWICVSRIPEHLKSREGLDAFLTELTKMQSELTGRGQKLCFHPVSADFLAVPGMDAVGYLLEKMPELPLCLDLYHLSHFCKDMPSYIRRYAGRICMVHMKDHIGDTLVPAGQGEIDWTGVVSACMMAGVPYAFVEQERFQRDPYLCLKKASDWLEREICAAKKD